MLKAPEIQIGQLAPVPSRERILVYGTEGSGKTSAWLSIANLYQAQEMPNRFYVLDTEDSVPRSMSNRYTHLENVHITGANRFNEYIEWAEYLQEVVQEGDWVVADSGSSGYEAATAYYLEKRYSQSRAVYELEHLLAGNKGPAIDPGDWVNIRNLFLYWWKNLVTVRLSEDFGIHVFATGEAKQLLEHYDAKKADTSAWLDYHEVGWRPDGHQKWPYTMHTVAYMKRSSSAWWCRTMKDRERETGNFKVNDFAIDYLLSVAGWEIV